MRRLIPGTVVAVCLKKAAGATSLSMNEVVLENGTDLATCKAAGAQAIARTGMRPAGESAASVFGEGADGLIAAICCLPDRGIAMIGIAGNSGQATRPVLAALLAAMSGD